jgi:hypothetical protein
VCPPRSREFSCPPNLSPPGPSVPKSLVLGAAARFRSALSPESSKKAQQPRRPSGKGSNYRLSRHGHLNTFLDESRRLMARQLVRDWCWKTAPIKPLSDPPS